MSNEKRINAAEQALEAHTQVKDPGTDEINFGDLLADMMHYARQYNIDFELELSMARRNFEAESDVSHPRA